MDHPTVIVESNLFHRRQMAGDLRHAGVKQVIEAISCNHGLEIIAGQPNVDTCLLGPRLKLRTATKFLTIGQQIAARRSRPCSFFVVIPPDADDLHRRTLEEAGADALLEGRIGEKPFSELVKRAVLRELPPHTAHRQTPSMQQVPFIPLSHRYQNARMGEVLIDLAERLTKLADEIDRGRFHVRKNGVPSLATADAIRLVLEAAFPVQAHVSTIGTPGHHFITAVVRWFESRPHLSHEGANEMLRQALLAAAVGASAERH